MKLLSATLFVLATMATIANGQANPKMSLADERGGHARFFKESDTVLQRQRRRARADMRRLVKRSEVRGL